MAIPAPAPSSAEQRAGLLPYRYVFEASEISAILACFHEHGFALIRQMAAPDIVTDLRAAVEQVLDVSDLRPGDNRTTPDFVEHAKQAIRLLDAPAYIALNRQLFGTEDLTIHRSFAVLKNAGAQPVGWHRDFHHDGEGQGLRPQPDELLDAGDHGFRALWYLDGSYPTQGGLWVIPDSHRDDWPGLPGFTFTAGRKSFHRVDLPVERYLGFDAPQMLPLHVDPGDLVLYSLKLYHGAYAQPQGLRRACAIILRPTEPALEVPWPQPLSSRRFVETVPERVRPFVRNYVGIDYQWDM